MNNSFERIKIGWELFLESLEVFYHHPKFIVPLLITWTIYAPILLFIRYSPLLLGRSLTETCLVIFGFLLLIHFLLAFAGSILLELIQQKETGNDLSLIKAFSENIRLNTLALVPLSFLWSIIAFILIFVEALFSKRRRSEEQSMNVFGPEKAAKTLSGNEDNSSYGWINLFIDSLSKGLRMIIFLILPAIAWENMTFIPALKRGLMVFRKQITEFTTGFFLSQFVTLIVFLPVTLFFIIVSNTNTDLPDLIWYLIILYCGFAWSYSIYVEQMYAAELYLWNLIWEKQTLAAQQEGKDPPRLQDIPRPSLLDDMPVLGGDTKIIYDPPIKE